MLMAMLLVGFWTWDRVVTDCKGGPERMSHYYLQATVRVMGQGACPSGPGNQTEPCLIAVPSTPLPFGPNIGDPGTGTTVTTYLDPIKYPSMLPIPPLGGFSAWPWPTADNPHIVISVDLQGNRCDQNCP
jgi:hypothetical protein